MPDDTERLANLIDIDAAAGLLRVATFEQVRNAACELHILQAARHFAQGIGDRLAIFEADDSGEAVAILRD